jgi:hypothetical protein
MPVLVDHDGRVTLFTCGDRNLFAKKGLTCTFDTAEKDTSAAGALIKRSENSLAVIYVLAVDLLGQSKVFNLLKEELTSPFVKFDGVGFSRKSSYA